jgi:ABC-type nitrate/sulfonate/bicarbonate transport system permease component
MAAVMSVDRKIVEVGRVFRLSGLAMVRRILLPAVMPSYVIALRADWDWAGCSWSRPSFWAPRPGSAFF